MLPLQQTIPVTASGQINSLASATTSSPTQNSEIAVIGIAGRFPGATTPDELYQLFIDRKEGLSTFAKDSSHRLPFDGSIYVPRKGALSGVEDFDPAFWGLKDDEARCVLSLCTCRAQYSDAETETWILSSGYLWIRRWKRWKMLDIYLLLKGAIA